mgnify:CR=1 FL=1
MDYITKPFSIGALQRKIRAMFAMLEHHRPAKDLYDDGRLFLDFSEQSAALNGKPITLSSMSRLIASELIALLVVGGEEDHHRVRVLRLNQPAQVIAVPVRQIDVQQHQVV